MLENHCARTFPGRGTGVKTAPGGGTTTSDAQFKHTVNSEEWFIGEKWGKWMKMDPVWRSPNFLRTASDGSWGDAHAT